MSMRKGIVASRVMAPLERTDRYAIVIFTEKSVMRRRLQFLLGAIFFALLLVYGGVRFYRSVALLDAESEPGWLARQPGSQVQVGTTGTPEAASLLRPGDEVIAINGEPIKRSFDVTSVFQRIAPDKPYTVLIRRTGIPFEVTLTSQAVPLIIWVVRGAALLIIPNIFLLTGLIVFMLKPYDKKALLLALMFGMFTGALF